MIVIYALSNGIEDEPGTHKEMKMTASLARNAYSSPFQAGERQTVRHVIGSRRPLSNDAVLMVTAGNKNIRHTGTANYAF